MNNKTKYDFVIVGAGFAGASCARLLTDKGYKCLVIEQRPFVSGNCVSDSNNDIEVHFFGPHILHTNNEEVWNFLKTYGDIHEWRYRRFAWNDGVVYQIPFGMDMIQKIYDVTWPYEAEKKLGEDLVDIESPKTIEQYSKRYFGSKIYETTIKNFYEKLYNKKCSELLKECMTEKFEPNIYYKDSYYPDIYQGVPEKGYVKLVEYMLGNDIDVILNTDFLSNKEKFSALGQYVIYTGELDKFFNYCMGALDWVSVIFDQHDESEKTNNLSGCPIIHFTDNKTQWYRMTEHKWLTPWRLGTSDEFDNTTYITYEYFKEWEKGEEAVYPMYTEKSLNLYRRYLDKLHSQYPNVILCGRKAKYTNQHICEVIEDAFKIADKFPDKD